LITLSNRMTMELAKQRQQVMTRLWSDDNVAESPNHKKQMTVASTLEHKIPYDMYSIAWKSTNKSKISRPDFLKRYFVLFDERPFLLQLFDDQGEILRQTYSRPRYSFPPGFQDIDLCLHLNVVKRSLFMSAFTLL
jgi:hypothetical protein